MAENGKFESVTVVPMEGHVEGERYAQNIVFVQTEDGQMCGVLWRNENTGSFKKSGKPMVASTGGFRPVVDDSNRQIMSISVNVGR